MNKSEVRHALNADLDAFLKKGGSVTVCRTARRKPRNSASGSQKLSFGWVEPKNRPSNAWDLIL